MRKTISMILLVSLWTQIVFAAGVPQKFPTDTLQIGKPSSSANKDLIFDTNLGASNPKVRANPTNGKFELNKPLDVTGAIGATGDISATGTGSIGGNLTIGTGAAADKSITVNRGGSNPFLKWSETALSWIFSNDGTLEKKLGTGGGGASTGVNVLTNDSFEDFVSGSLLGWSNVGGTLTQETYTNGAENDTKYFQFVATGAGQYFESALITVPTNFNGGGCQVDFKKLNIATNDLFKVEALNSSNGVLASGNVKVSSWVKFPTLRFLCPAAGATFRIRVTSLAAGTLQGDKAYLGSNQNIVESNCQGTKECEDVFSALVTSTGVVSSENLDFINGNCTNGATGQYACTFNSGIFTVTPSCTMTNTAEYQAYINSASSVNINPRTFNSAGTPTNASFQVHCQKQGVDYVKAKPQTAVTNEQSSWFIDANIGGQNPNLGVGNQTSYIEIPGTTLDLVNNTAKGSAPVEIACANGFSSVGNNCGANNESIGIAFVPPSSGLYEACFSFSHNANSVNGMTSYFQIAETSNTSSAILTEGGQRIGGGHGNGISVIYPQKVCGTFNFSDTSKKTIRLMYEQNASSGNASSVFADRDGNNGQRDISVTVRPLLSAFNRPILTGDQVTTKGTVNPQRFNLDYYTGSIGSPCSSNPCGISQDGSYVSALNWSSAGVMVLHTNKTYTSMRCGILNGTGQGGVAVSGYNIQSCTNCNQLSISTVNTSNQSYTNSFGVISCDVRE